MRRSAVDAAIGSDNLVRFTTTLCRWRFPVPPEVIAWTLLFVVAFALVYRFFAWVGGRRNRAPSLAAQRDHVQRPVETVVAPETAIADRAAAEAVAVEPVVIAPTIPAPTVQANEQPEAAQTEPPPPLSLPLATVPEIIAPPLPMPSTAVMSARIAAEAVRTAMAPSVAATLPPRPKPSVAATLPPEPVAPPAAEPAPLDAAPPVESSKTHAAFPSGPVQDDVSISEDEPEHNESTSPLPLQGVVEVSKSARFRARRIGLEAPSLDIRLRDSRERRCIPVPKTVRGPSEPVAAKGLKVLAPKGAPEKAPTRRIGRKPDGENLLATARSQTRIIGAAQRPSRILTASAF